MAKRTIAFLGFGRFGRALGALLNDAGYAVRALDPNGTEFDAATAVSSPRELVLDAELVVLAVPVRQMREGLLSVRPYLTAEHRVMDVGSVKMGPTAEMQAILGDSVPWVGTHPLFGPLSLARAERPLRVIVCPNASHQAATQWVVDLYTRVGCEILMQSPSEHDQVMADTHALTFFIAKGMIESNVETSVAFAPPSFHAIAKTVEAVRADAGHLFAALQRENPFAAATRERFLQALIVADQQLREMPTEAEPPSRDLSIADLGAHCPELRETRELIDEVDEELIALLARRAELARKTARAKAAMGKGILDPVREQMLIAARRKQSALVGLDEDAMERIFRAIIAFSREHQADR